MSGKRYFLLKYVLPLTLLLGSCSQTKNTALLRGWHNMNARYNGTYYSKENLKESIVKVEKENKDDFSKPLPLFVYPDNESAKNFFNDFDNTIKKSSIVIQRHVIMHPKSKLEIPNACRWIDENYMLIGKSHLYKRDLFSALEAFEYVSKIYPQPKAKYSGMLWMIRADNEIGSYSLSESILDELKNAKDFPKERSFERERALVSADLFMKRGDIEQAIKQLKIATILTRKKSAKARYMYILAQLYEKIGETKSASHFYSMVPRLHPNYEMEFNAKINQARFYDIGLGDSKAIRKQLMKMLRDDKNIEFRDQIYYALAELSRKEGDDPGAVGYLDNSIEASTTNSTQKALSYLKRGDIYFDKTNYKQAQSNYDSAMVILPADYPNFKEWETKKNSLTALVMNLTTIEYEDSVQALARMSDADRMRAIDNRIKQEEEAEKKAEEVSALKQEQVISATPVDMTQPSLPPGVQKAWYFYTPATVKLGIAEFEKKWGQRQLEDNWRRSQKDPILENTEVAVSSTDSINANQNPIAKTTVSGAKKDRVSYLKNIPLTTDAVLASNTKIINAYYNVGSIYKEQLMNINKSTEAFEELLKRFPENSFLLSTYYQLYRSYLTLNNQPKSEYYKNLLLTKYPESEYAKIIKNPDYAKDVNASRNIVEHFYNETYQLYAEEKYKEVIANCTKAESIYAKSALMPQFSFLKALSIGRTQDISAFESALTQVVIKYPKAPVKTRAEELLKLIEEQKRPRSTSVAKDTVPVSGLGSSTFVLNDTDAYYWIALVENGKGDIENFKISLSTINASSFGTKNLLISNVLLDSVNQLISVKSFGGKAEAMQYYKYMNTDEKAYEYLNGATFKTFIISAENYIKFYKEKDVAAYEEFFIKNYE